jgi:putative DNA primase/helicase
MLKGVRFVHTTEPEKGGKLSEGLVKLVTGGDAIPVRELNHPYFMLRPAFKLIMSGNFRPRIEGGDPSHGIWRRMTLVPWTVTIGESKVDKRLPQKLQAEASGILNRLLDGLRDWRDRALVLPDEVIAATEQYRSDSDPLGRFLAACTVADPSARAQSSELHQVFCAWARANGEREWTANGFGRAMIERGYERKKADVHWWLGLKLIKTVNAFVDNEGKPLRQAGRAAAGEQGEAAQYDDAIPL